MSKADSSGFVRGFGTSYPPSTARPAAVLFVLALLVTSCSGSDSAGAASSSTSPQMTTANAVDEAPPDTSATAPTVAAAQEPTERSSHIYLPDGTPIEYLYRSFIQLPVGMTRGPDGLIYIADHGGRHVVRITAEGEAEDLGIWRKNPGIWETDGPIDLAFDSEGTLFVNDHANIYRIDSEGYAEALPGVMGGPSGIAFGKYEGDDVLYYTNRSGDPLTGGVRWWFPEGRSGVVALNIPGAEDIVVGEDGSIYVSQIRRDSIVKIDPSWEAVTEFAAGGFGLGREDPLGLVPVEDQLFLTIGPEGDIWARGSGSLRRFSPEGTEKPFDLLDGPPSDHDWQTSAGLAFDAEGRLWVAAHTSKVFRLDPTVPLADGADFGVTSAFPGLEGSDLAIGPSGEVITYNGHTRELWRIDSPETVMVLSEFAAGDHGGVAIDSSGTVFVGQSGEIMFLDESNQPVHYASVKTRRMVFGTDGAMYAVAGDQTKSIVRITGTDGVEPIAADLSGNPSLGDAHIAVAPDGGLYVYDEDSRGLYILGPDWESREIANLQSLGGVPESAMTAGPAGEMYLVPHHRFVLFRIGADGQTEEWIQEVKGDPGGMVVSSDGKILYIAASGSIVMIPIG